MMHRTNKRLNWPLLILAVAFVSFAGYHSVALSNLAAKLQPAVIATVDLERLFNNLDERSAADAELQALADDLQAQGDALAAEIEEIQENVDMFQAGTQQHQDALNQLARKSSEYRAFVEWGRRRIDARKAATLRRIYETSIKSAITREAEANGYDVVFVNDSLAGIPRGDEAETSRQISARRMLYSATRIDITQDIISRMNREFSAERR